MRIIDIVKSDSQILYTKEDVIKLLKQQEEVMNNKAKALPIILHTLYNNSITQEAQQSDLALNCDISHGGAIIYYKPIRGGGNYRFCVCCGNTLSEAVDIAYQRVNELHLTEEGIFVDEVRNNR